MPAALNPIQLDRERAVLICPTQVLKETLVDKEVLADGVKLHVTCSLIASFSTCVAGNPLDVVRTRLYNQPRGLNGEGLLYSNWLEAMYKIPSAEGLGALYKVRPCVDRWVTLRCKDPVLVILTPGNLLIGILATLLPRRSTFCSHIRDS